MTQRRTGTREEWLSARLELLEAEKDLTRRSDELFRTYFTTRRGVEALGSVWSFLDLTPLGRQEDWEDSPDGYPQTKPYEWWRRHDDYEDAR